MSSIESIALAPTAAQAAAKDRADLIRHQAAIRAVLDLHERATWSIGLDAPRVVCVHCCSYDNDWPCDTVQAITTALETKP